MGKEQSKLGSGDDELNLSSRGLATLSVDELYPFSDLVRSIVLANNDLTSISELRVHTACLSVYLSIYLSIVFYLSCSIYRLD